VYGKAFAEGKEVEFEAVTPFFVGRVPGSKQVAVFKLKDDDGLEKVPCEGDVEVIKPLLEQEVPTVSRCHVRVLEDDGNLLVIDHGVRGEGSSNGTLFEGYGKVKAVKANSLVFSIPASSPVVSVFLSVAPVKAPFLCLAEALSKLEDSSTLFDLKRIVDSLEDCLNGFELREPVFLRMITFPLLSLLMREPTNKLVILRP